MAQSIKDNFSLEDAVTAYWRLRERGQNGVMARLSVEARSVDWSADQRRALHAMLNPYDEPPEPANWRAAPANAQEQS